MLSQAYEGKQDIPNFGAGVIGASFRYIMTSEVDETQYVRVAVQQPQNAFDSLLLPYVYHGIGRSNNYVEQFNVAYSSSNQLNQVKVFTPIIPNSQLFIIGNSQSK